jgi:hypothetical protein
MSSADTKAKPNSNSEASSAAAISSFWAQWLEQSSRGTQAFLEVIQAAGDPQQIQRRWLEAVSRSLDEFMRTPVFLELLKNNLKAVTDLKGLQDQILEDTARQFGVPQAKDITGLFERLNSTEQTILARLNAIEERLKNIESKR